MSRFLPASPRPLHRGIGHVLASRPPFEFTFLANGGDPLVRIQIAATEETFAQGQEAGASRLLQWPKRPPLGVPAVVSSFRSEKATSRPGPSKSG